MVEDRAFAGKKALGALFHRYRTELGNIRVVEYMAIDDHAVWFKDFGM